MGYLFAVLILSTVFFVPLRKLSIADGFKLYLLIFLLGIAQLIILIPLAGFTYTKLISVQVSTLLGISIIYPFTEECFKYVLIKKDNQPQSLFNIAWAIAGFETFVAYFTQTQRNTLTGKAWPDGEKPGWDQALWDTFLIRSPSVLMHLITCYILWHFIKNMRRPWLGIGVTFVIHGAFNYYVKYYAEFLVSLQ